jgi:hypothetical protein
MYKVVKAKDLRKDKVLAEIYCDLRDDFWVFVKKDEGVEFDEDELDRELGEYLVRIDVVDRRIYIRAGRDLEDLAKQATWEILDFVELCDPDEVLRSIVELPDVE